jgi:hypothetical protein
MRVLIHREYGHPMRRVVTERELSIRHTHGVRKRSPARDHEHPH